VKYNIKPIWDPGICKTVTNGSNSSSLLDLNRLRFLGFPPTNIIRQGKAEFANRDDVVYPLNKAMVESDYSEVSLHSYYSTTLKKYAELCDANHIDIFSESSISAYEDYLYFKYMENKIKNSTYTREISDLTRLFKFLELPVTWFSNVRVLGANQRQSFEAYSQQDLKILLPLLRGLFKQLAKQFISNPFFYINTNKTVATFTFTWKGVTYPIYGGITKLIASATYLLSYYTWSNASVLYQLKRPNLASHSLSDTWYSMPAFKRRSFKTLTVDMGGHELEIPKYSMEFFDKLLEVSRLIDSSKDALLLQTIISKKRKAMTANLLGNSVKEFMLKKFSLIDNRGKPLHPVISRFRETGSKLTIARKGDMEAALLLDNTPDTVKKSYSKGNEFENNKMINETVSILEAKVKNKCSVSEAKEQVKNNLDIEVLTFEEYLAKKAPLVRNAHGSHCKNNKGEEAEKFGRKVKKHSLSLGEKLVCADLLSCFECKHQVIVESVNDIWCLLSFKECIEESKYAHLDISHFEKNYRNTLTAIEKIFTKINRKIFKKASVKLSVKGRHPLWIDYNDLSIVGAKNET
tara:strand:+ start:3944 stop:5674 length:1731 start_codon:yes stop_codon:yes gene_type:complete